MGHYNQAEHISAPRLMNIICSDDLDDDNDDQKNLTWQMIRVLRFANEFPKALYKSPDYLMTIVILQEIMTTRVVVFMVIIATPVMLAMTTATAMSILTIMTMTIIMIKNFYRVAREASCHLLFVSDEWFRRIPLRIGC